MYEFKVYKLGSGNPLEEPIVCPKCNYDSGDSWAQCGGSCPMEMSPHYDPAADFQLREDYVEPDPKYKEMADNMLLLLGHKIFCEMMEMIVNPNFYKLELQLTKVYFDTLAKNFKPPVVDTEVEEG